MTKNKDCFDYRFTSEGVKYGFCKLMVEHAKSIGAMAVDYVAEKHEHGEMENERL